MTRERDLFGSTKQPPQQEAPLAPAAVEPLEGRLLLSSQFVFGTEGSDIIRLAVGPDSFTVTVNGTTNELPFKNGRKLILDGLGGDDVVDIFGSSMSKENLSLWPGRGTLSGGGRHHYKVLLEGLETIHFSGQADGRLRLYGSAGDDSFAAGPFTGSMVGDGYTNFGGGFSRVYGYGLGGADRATFTDSPVDDKLSASPSAARLTGWGPNNYNAGTQQGYSNYAGGFEQVFARAVAGGADSASIRGSHGADQLSASGDWVRLEGSGFSFDLSGFDTTVANSGGGHNDVAYLDSGDLGAVISSQGLSTLTLANRQIVAKGFEDVQNSLPPGQRVDVPADVVRAEPIAFGSDLDLVVSGTKGAATALEFPYTFIVGLGREALIRQIEFTWYMPGNSPTEYTISIVDDSAALDSTVAVESPTVLQLPEGQVQVLKFDQPLRAAFLRIRMDGGNGRDAGHGGLAELLGVRILADEPTPMQSILLDPANAAPLLGATDHSNPLWIFSQEIPLSVQKVAQQAIEGLGELTDFQKIVAFMHLFDSARSGNPSGASAVPMLLENIGDCGNFANTLLSLAVSVGIPGRLVNLSNFPADNGHTVAELYLDGRWSLFDPTFGIYYTTDPSNTVDPYVLSFDELHAGRGLDPDVTRIVGNPQRLALWGDGPTSFANPRIYMLADPAGPIGPDLPMVYPLSLDLTAKPSIDLDDFGPFNQGASFLGSAYVNASQEFTLSGLTAGAQYSLTIAYSLAGGYPDGRTVFDARSEMISGGTLMTGQSYTFALWQENDPWTITFSAGGPEVELLLTHDYLDYFYISAESYTLAGI